MSLVAHPTSGLLLVGSPAQGGSGLLAVSTDCCCFGSGDNECDDGCTWRHFQLIDQTGGCVCMHDTVTPIVGGSFWGASGCEGSVSGEIFCTNGRWRTTVTGVFPTGSATVFASVYTPCVEIIFQLPTLACVTGNPGTAKLRITP